MNLLRAFGHSLRQRYGRSSGTRRGKKAVKLVVAVAGGYPGSWVRDGTLYGGSANLTHANKPSFWLSLRLDHEPHALFFARNVPEQIAKHIEDHGTSAQHYSDGYEGLAAIAPYLDADPFYESPAEWASSKDEDEEGR